MSLLKSILDLLFPPECQNCGKEEAWLCESCFELLRLNEIDNKEKLKNLSIPDLDSLFIAGDYDDPLLSALIKKFKYNFLSELGPVLGRFLFSFWNKLDSDLKGRIVAKQPAIMPIPLSKRRERWRGFNQSEILAHRFSLETGLKTCSDLKRIKNNKPQAELSEKRRLENIRGIFGWRGGSLYGQNFILIDDVVTTGATLNEAARVLKAAGAKEVYGLVLAKG